MSKISASADKCFSLLLTISFRVTLLSGDGFSCSELKELQCLTFVGVVTGGEVSASLDEEFSFSGESSRASCFVATSVSESPRSW